MKTVIKILTVAALFSSANAFASSRVICSDEAPTAKQAAASLTNEMYKLLEKDTWEFTPPVSVIKPDGTISLCVTAKLIVQPLRR
jgi:hypothetical protein